MHVRDNALFALTLAFGLSLAAAASAQRPLQQVLDLNRQAMEAYNNLEVDVALQKLEEAQRVARRGNVTGAPLARTFLNLGVVHVGGLQDNGQGLTYFMQALEIDPNIQLDPLTSTPDIQTVFNLARQRVGRGASGGAGGGGAGGGGTGGGGAGGGGTGGGGTGGTGGGRPVARPTAGNIPHTPIPEQLSQTAVPIFLEVPAEADVGSVFVFYKTRGMRDFRRAQMQRMTGGFGFEIPCSEVYEPKVEYYIVVYASDNTPLGFAGTQQQPIEVPIVTSRSHPEPALPGRPPPQRCSLDDECPPGMAGCSGRGSAGMGDPCRSNRDCSEGLVCEDDLCSLDDGGGGGSDDGGGRGGGGAPRFFLHLGVTTGFGYLSSGMPADQGPVVYDPPEEFRRVPYEEGGVRVPYPSSYEGCLEDPSSAMEMGFPALQATASGRAVGCTVRVGTPGFLPSFAIRGTLGYYVTERLAIAGSVRFQPVSGVGTLSNLLLQLRAQYLLTDPAATGVHVAPFLGGSAGQIQFSPDQQDLVAPWIRSGLGGVQVGSVVGYRFVKNFGLVATPEIHVLFPDFMFVFDVSFSIEVGF
jgi:hypothetical protein